MGMTMAYICPHCKNSVEDDEALLCLFCGESLGRGSRFPAAKPLFYAILAVLVVSLLLTFLLH
jgi:predicted nucleic acid-binding Zn ribbon protein